MKPRILLFLVSWIPYLSTPILLLGLLFTGFRSHAQEQAWEILTPEGEVTYDFNTGVATATGGVIVKYGGAILTANQAAIDQATTEVIADGDVRIQRNEQVWVGEHIRYNFKTRQMEAQQFRTGKTPVFAAGQGLAGDLTNKVYIATNAFVTTDDFSEPFLKVRTKRLKIVPGNYVQAQHAVLYLGDVPVFYFPYYKRNLGARVNNFNFVPGYRSRYGPFLLGSYNWFWGEQLDGAVHVDYRQRRGFGAGPDFNYHLGKWGDGTLQYYYLHDKAPALGSEDVSTDGVSIPDNRQRLYFSHLANPFTNLTARAVVRYQSDPRIMRDFFEGEYRQNPQPNTFVEINKFWQNFSLDTFVQPRVNDFFETVERLPDIKLTGFRQQLGDSPLFYESESSVGYNQRRFADTNGPPLGLDYSAARADTLHQLLLPQTFFGWLNVTPRVGGRFTYYSEADGTGATTSEKYRGVFNTGAEVSFKASRVWAGVQNDFFEVDGLRHIIEPSVNYVFVPRPNVLTNELPQFDYEQTSLRLLPIEFPEFNSIDSIDSQNVFRFGLRNKLQTKRKEGIDNLVNWEIFTDWRLHPRSGQTTFSDIYSDLVARPRSWLTLESETRFDIDRAEWRLAFHTLTIQPNNVWNWSIAHRYVRDNDPELGSVGNNLIASRFFYRLNENWGVQLSHHFEARDGRMEEQYYTIYRDLRSWTAALTLRLRDNRVGPDDFTVAVTFSLKAFPRYRLGSDSVKPYSLLGS